MRHATRYDFHPNNRAIVLLLRHTNPVNASTALCHSLNRLAIAMMTGTNDVEFLAAEPKILRFFSFPKRDSSDEKVYTVL